ncbi:PAX-interacting protein 1 [Hordeum vulgare]|nr:PAX-interacting protein 1 [Hordeum vulgare]
MSSSGGTGEGSDFILVNPNEADSLNKSLLQEVLRLYKKEFSTMDYAANTGKNQCTPEFMCTLEFLICLIGVYLCLALFRKY